MTDEYERYLDSEASEFMEKITFAQITEALNSYSDKAGKEELLAESVRRADVIAKYAAGQYLTAICYEYWRGCLDTKHSFDIKSADPFGRDLGDPFGDEFDRCRTFAGE